MKSIFIGLTFILLFTGCVEFILPLALIHPVLITMKHDTPIHRFEGYAFDAIINSVPVIELTDKKDLLSLEKYYDKRSIHWQTMKPISGLIDVEIKRKYIKEYDIGEIDVSNFRLSCIQLPWEKNSLKPLNINRKKELLLTNGNVIIGGVPYNSSLSDTFPSVPISQGKSLLDGNYIVMIHLQGTDGWDRKEIYVEVRADANNTIFF